MQTFVGMVDEIIYKNEMNGYTVFQLTINDDAITAVGYVPFISEGENIKIAGKWTTHPEYGEQLKIEYFEKMEPSTVQSIEKYLASGIIKGLGPKTAEKIVQTFGKDSLFIIENTPEQLCMIKGISISRAMEIRDSYMEQRELKQIVMFLQEYNISPTFAVKIFKRFGKDTINVIKENPYKLGDEIFGIGFKIADKIAMNLGVDKNSEYRICAGIKYILSQYANVGHTFMPREELLNYGINLLETNRECVENCLVRLTIDKQIYIEEIGEYQGVYLSSFYYAEQGVVRKLIDLSFTEYNHKFDIDKKIEEIEKEQNICLQELQRLAIKESMNNGVLVLTGGPGTGKTTIINCILSLFDHLKYEVALAAPTGRAAKRMSEACKREAKTIHRLLEIGYTDGEDQVFARDENNPLNVDAVIIDEVSMVDILLMNNLLKAIRTGTKLILVGDIDQLPSVGPGSVLKDIINSGIIKMVRLTEIFRQAQESMIVVNAHKINKGEYPYLNTRDKDFFLIKKNRQDGILSEILGLIKDRIPKYNNYDKNSIQILTPMRKGPTGVFSLNNELQSVLNPPSKKKRERKFRDIVFRENDKVMQIKNNYNTLWTNIENREEGVGVFNGDIGIIKEIDTLTETMKVLFDDTKEVIYNFSELEELELAYAITVHKSQGCEFPVVIMPVSAGPPMLLTRNLLYTAITRAKELVVLVGNEEYLKLMIDNNTESKRYSGLCERLKKAMI